MIDRFTRFLKEPTSTRIIINTVGNYLSTAFTVLFALILFRTMNPIDYGIFSVLIGFAYVLSNILEFGTTASIYATIPNLYHVNSEKLYTYIKSTFLYQTILSTIIIGALAILFPKIDELFFKTHVDNWVLLMTSGTILLYVWQNFLTNVLFASNRFFHANLYQNISNLVKAIILIVLASQNRINVANVIMTYGLIGPSVFFVLVLIKHRGKLEFFKRASARRSEIKLNYTLTNFAASQFYNVGLRMDLFLLSFFGLKEQVGYYASAQKIMLSVTAITVSISQVLSTQFACAKNNEQVMKLFKKGTLYMLIPMGIFIAILITPDSIFTLILTSNFEKAISVTKLLATSYILSTIGTLFVLYLLYTVKKPIYILVANFLFFAITTIGSFFLIPKFGMHGPPYAVFVAFCVAIVVLIASYKKEIQSKFHFS